MGSEMCIRDRVVAGVCGESQIENLVKRSLHSFTGVAEFIHLFADRMHFSCRPYALVFAYLAVVLPFLFLLPSFLPSFLYLVCTV